MIGSVCAVGALAPGHPAGVSGKIHRGQRAIAIDSALTSPPRTFGEAAGKPRGEVGLTVQLTLAGLVINGSKSAGLNDKRNRKIGHDGQKMIGT